MANTRSAKKNVRQNKKRRLRNLARRSALKTAIKKARREMESATDLNQVKPMISDIAARLARAKSKGVIHPRTASRKLSRLMKKMNKAAAASQPQATA